VHVVRTAVDTARLRILRVAHKSELGCEDHLVSPIGDRLAHQLLVRERPVHVGRVEEVDAKLERVLDRRDRLALVLTSVELRHPHAAEPFGRHDESL
jgi:hypothetical protein